MDNKSCFEMIKLCVFFSRLLISPIIASTNDLCIVKCCGWLYQNAIKTLFILSYLILSYLIFVSLTRLTRNPIFEFEFEFETRSNHDNYWLCVTHCENWLCRIIKSSISKVSDNIIESPMPSFSLSFGWPLYTFVKSITCRTRHTRSIGSLISLAFVKALYILPSLQECQITIVRGIASFVHCQQQLSLFTGLRNWQLRHLLLTEFS